ncbi:hypothetical protein V8F20_012834, partial [Naviculisporaceae sp. PSN 640]
NTGFEKPSLKVINNYKVISYFMLLGVKGVIKYYFYLSSSIILLERKSEYEFGVKEVGLSIRSILKGAYAFNLCSLYLITEESIKGDKVEVGIIKVGYNLFYSSIEISIFNGIVSISRPSVKYNAI